MAGRAIRKGTGRGRRMNRQQKGPDPSRPSPIRQHPGFYQVRPIGSRVSSSGPDMSSKRGLLFDAVQLGSTLAVLPVAQEDMPRELREAITRRRIATITGVCPCGGRFELGEPHPLGEPSRATVWHENDCPAQEKVFDRLLGSWQATPPRVRRD